MTKAEAIKAIKALYRVMNRADHETKADWTIPTMTGEAGCAHMDALLRSWLDGNAINAFAIRTEHGGTLRTLRFEPGNDKARERARQEANRQRDAWLTRTDRFIGVKLYVEPVSV